MIDDFQYKRLDFKKILLGILSERSRWRDCVDWTNKRLGMAVGALFIRDNFSLDSKVRYKCIRSLKIEYKDKIEKLRYKKRYSIRLFILF